MNAPLLEVSYDVTLEDALEFAVYHHRTSPVIRRRWHLLRVGLSALLAVIAATIGGLARSPLLSIVGFAAALGFWFIFPRRYEKGLRDSVRKLYGEGRNVDLLGPTKLVIDPEHVTESTPTREVRTRWAAVERCVETEDHLFIYVTGSTAFIVPKKSLRPGDAERLVSELESRLASRRSDSAAG